MYAAPFEYVRAGSWEEAVERLRNGGEDAHAIAGGQSLVPMMMARMAVPSVLVDLTGAGERAISRGDGELVLSALVRHADLERSPAVRDACPMLADAAARIGNVRVRHRGTIGGSLAHNDPAAELPCVALALGASVRALGPGGERTIPAAELFVTHMTTSLEPGELITDVRVPALRPRQGWAFAELARRTGDFAMAEVAVLVSLDADGLCAGVRLAIGATADRPFDLSPTAAAALQGEDLGERAADAARAVAEEAEIGPSPHASVGYRREAVAALTRRALLAAAARAQWEGDGR